MNITQDNLEKIKELASTINRGLYNVVKNQNPHIEKTKLYKKLNDRMHQVASMLNMSKDFVAFNNLFSRKYHVLGVAINVDLSHHFYTEFINGALSFHEFKHILSTYLRFNYIHKKSTNTENAEVVSEIAATTTWGEII